MTGSAVIRSMALRPVCWAVLAVCFLVLTVFPLMAAVTRIPSSPRARAAIQRVRPALERDLADRDLRFGSPIFIRIFKRSKALELWVKDGDRYRLFRTYPVCAMSGDLGPKLREGDRQAPEGFYRVWPGQLNPASAFHLSFDLGYPNAYDRAQGRTGSAIMVHGGCASIGCFAMTDEGIEEIYAMAVAALDHGQPFFRVHVYPFRMADELMRCHEDSDWFGFWESLREFYDFFDRHGFPARIAVKDGQYVFVES